MYPYMEYRNGATETFFLHLQVIRCDVWGHMTSPLQVKMARYEWTENHEREKCLQSFWTANKHKVAKANLLKARFKENRG